MTNTADYTIAADTEQGTVVMGWKEHAMPAHRLLIQTMQLPGSSVAQVEINANGP